MCALTNERYKTYQTGFSLCCLGHDQGVGLWGAKGAQGVIFFSNMVMWFIKLTGMASRTEYKYNFHLRVKLDDLGVRSKVKYH